MVLDPIASVRPVDFEEVLDQPGSLENVVPTDWIDLVDLGKADFEKTDFEFEGVDPAGVQEVMEEVRKRLELGCWLRHFWLCREVEDPEVREVKAV